MAHATTRTAPDLQPRRRGSPVAVIVVLVLLAGGAVAGWWFLLRDDANGSGPSAVATVSSDASAVLETPGGVMLEIPVGAVPETRDGAIGEVVFTMDEQTVDDRQANLPEGLSLAETAVEIGPDFQTLAAPAVLSLPIPDDVPIERVGGLAWFDPQTDGWVMVPSRVDEGARVVSADVTHFSMWSWWHEREDSDRRWKAEHGGYVAVANQIQGNIVFPTDFFGWGDRRTSYTSYGICVDRYFVEDEAMRSNTWWQPTDWMIMQRAYPGSDFERPQEGEHEVWLPQGEYQLREVLFFSELNRLIGYVPAYGWASRPLATAIVASGGERQYTWREEERVDDYSLGGGGWVPGRPECAGTAMHAPGHGDVQVQLIWPEENVDLDLHVIEPDGFEIYYADRSSASGGWLDHDNTFGAGTPENVFWEDPPAGTYRVELVYFSGEPTAHWTVRTIVEGEIEIFEGTIAPSSDGEEPVVVTEFRVD
ncbi:MAG: hypothetical protein R3290_04115 [Acidimicrobiia bacterium]|nr:hypothetical protein [Acidimicrobiia bacterium]